MKGRFWREMTAAPLEQFILPRFLPAYILIRLQKRLSLFGRVCLYDPKNGQQLKSLSPLGSSQRSPLQNRRSNTKHSENSLPELSTPPEPTPPQAEVEHVNLVELRELYTCNPNSSATSPPSRLEDDGTGSHSEVNEQRTTAERAASAISIETTPVSDLNQSDPPQRLLVHQLVFTAVSGPSARPAAPQSSAGSEATAAPQSNSVQTEPATEATPSAKPTSSAGETQITESDSDKQKLSLQSTFVMPDPDSPIGIISMGLQTSKLFSLISSLAK